MCFPFTVYVAVPEWCLRAAGFDTKKAHKPLDFLREMVDNRDQYPKQRKEVRI